MKKIYSNNWDFIVFEGENDEKIISVVFHNSFVDISRKFLLIDKELNYGFDELKNLAEHIRNNYDEYKTRELINSQS